MKKRVRFPPERQPFSKTAMETDSELLRRYVEERSQSAFTALVQRHIGIVYSVALRRVGGDAHLAEDVAQKVFVALARKAPSLLARPTLSAWLFVSAHMASADIVRGEQRRKTRETEASSMQTTLSAQEPDRDWIALRPLLDHTLVTLKDQDREAIALRFFEQRSFAEIGALLRVSEEAARKRVDRALEKLRALLARRGVTSTTAALSLTLAASGNSLVPAELSARLGSHAFAEATVATGSLPAILTALKTTAPIAAAIAVGALFINGQRQTNRSLAHEVTRLSESIRDLDAVRDENARLARHIAEANTQREAAQTQLPAHRSALTPGEPPAPPTAAVITLTEAGTIQWGNDFVSLREFLDRLQALRNRSPDVEPRITFRASSAASAGAARYVVEEARRAEVGVLVIADGPIAPSKDGGWF
jgi:RNA polymerase sigma factor (sigma-70 family)